MSELIKIYHDRALIDSIPSDVKNILYSHKLLLDKDRNIQFCGMVISDNHAHVFFPRNSALATVTKGIESSSRLFIQAIYNFSLQSKAIQYADDEGAGFVGESQLGSIMSLLKDYQINGLYSHRLTETVFNSGKTNWNKTISRSTAFPSENGAVYFDTWGTKHRYSQESEVTKIHAAVMRMLISRFGWLVSSDFKGQDLKQVPTPKSTKLSTKLSLIERELQVTYSDRDIWLLSQLKRFLSQQRGSQPVTEVMGIRSFHVMWEHMLSKVLMHKFEVNSLLPSPAYMMQNENGEHSIMEAKRNSQRTDIVLKRPNKEEYCVIDAKYYGAASIDSVPKWADLVKQFFYVTALKTILPTNSLINNAFIFPGSKIGPITSVHMRDKESSTLLNEIYPPIKCYYVCPNVLVECYVNNKTMANFSDLLLTGGESTVQ